MKVTRRLMSVLIFVIAIALAPIVTFVVMGANGTLPAPTNLTARAESNGILLEWQYSEPDTIDHFEIVSNPNTNNEFLLGIVEPTQTSYLDELVSCGQSYSYGVRAYLYDQESQQDIISEYAIVEGTAAACAELPPVADFSAQQISERPIQIELSWSPYSDPASIDGFDIVRAQSDMADEPDYIDNVSSSETSYTDTDEELTCGTTYIYAVQAYGEAGFSQAMTEIRTTECADIQPVTELSANQLSQDPVQVELTWNYANPDSIEGFEIVSQPSTVFESKEGELESDQSSYLLEGLTCDTSYSYGVSAYAGATISEYATLEFRTESCVLPEMTISASGPGSANPGDLISYSLTVNNSGATSAPYLVIYNVLPLGAEFVSADNGGELDPDTHEVLWELGPLQAGASQTVEFTVKASQDMNNSTYGVFTVIGANVVEATGQPVATEIGSENPDVNVCVANLSAPIKRFMPNTISRGGSGSAQDASGSSQGEARNAQARAHQPTARLANQARSTSQGDRKGSSYARSALDSGGSLKPEAQGNGIIKGTVQVNDGNPAAQATVCAYWYGSEEKGKSSCVSTNRQGHFTLTGLNHEDDWLVKPISAGVYLASPEREAYVEFDQHTSPYTLTEPLIVSLPNVTGTFVLGDGQNTPLAGVFGDIAPLNTDGSVDLAESGEFMTDQNGQFRAGTLPAGEYEISLDELPDEYLDDGYVLPEPRPFTITSATTVTNLPAITIPKAVKFIVGKVTTSDGTGVANVSLEAIRANEEDDEDDFQFALSDENGNYRIAVEAGAWTVLPIPPVKDGSNWVFTGTPQSIQFTKGASVAEEKSINFELQQVNQFITGRIVRPDGTPLTNSDKEGGTASIELWDIDNERYSYISLAADGTFRAPALDGFYEIIVWLDEVQYSDLVGPAIAPREVLGSNVDLGDIKLVSRFATISGTVTEKNSTRPVPDVFIDIWDPAGRWFGTETDENGKYKVNVPPGNWEIAADLFSDARYVVEQESKSATLSASQRQATVDFELSKADQRLSGSFVNGSGNLVEVAATVYLIRPTTGQRITTGPVHKGGFNLPLPNDCVESQNVVCQLGVDLALNAHHSINGASNITVSADGSASATFTVTENNARISGSLVDPTTTQPVSGLNGVVTLIPEGERTPAKSAQIQANGSYELTKVGAGQFSLSYELEIGSQEVLVDGKYLDSPTFPFSLTVPAGEQITRNILLERGTTFEITVTSDNDQAGVTDYYPAVVSCEYNDQNRASVVSVPDGRKKKKKKRCKKKPRYKTVCSRGGGRMALSDFFANEPYRFNLEEYLFNDLVPQNCQVEFGNAPVNNLNQSGGAGGSTRNINPTAQLFGTVTGDMTLQARTRNVYLVGQVFDKNGALIRDASVEVVAYSEGEDGQVERMMTDANGCYRLNVSQSEANWSLDASGERNGFYISAQGSIRETTPNQQGVIFGPPLQLTSTGEQVIPADNHAFKPKEGTSYQFVVERGSRVRAVEGVTAATQATSRTVRVNVPADATPTKDSQVKLSISRIPAPNTGFNELIGNAYRIQFVEGSKKREISSRLRVPISVELPYNAAQLPADVTPDKLNVAYFSYQTNSWTPIAGGKVDETAEVVKVKLDQTVDAIAILAPSEDAQPATQAYNLYLPMSIR